MLINILLLIVVVLSGMILACYNNFVRKNNRVKERASHIDVLLNQRFDLIPNIVECVKGYASHESSTLEELTNLRSNYNKNTYSIKDNEVIDKKFNNVMLLAEAYPDLKANEQFLSLQRNLNEIENNLSNARASYNRAVNVYNNLVESVPSNIIAKIFGFEKKEFFKLEEDKKANVSVNLEN